MHPAVTRPFPAAAARHLCAVVAVAVLSATVPERALGAVHPPRDLLDARGRLYATAYAWSDQHQVLRVTTIDADERRQERTIELYERRYRDGARKVLLVFVAPD